MLISLDQDSYQARIAGDDHFFLRRLLVPAQRLTDLNFGALEEGRQPSALHHFMICTGGWPTDYVEFDAIGHDEDSRAMLDKNAAHIIKLVNGAIPWANVGRTEQDLLWRRVLLRLHLT
ncbi:hypothetical protein [Sulfitobacter guttiformis]|uniref:Uncharacterized protein n=1 Tax=Sulfitobacter guttiformis TaxID=74349 RepID=A0A420DUB1_9RHOB|nr:hypothetical protein [Sulfitobacter guttiformis]KIN71283.1 hypothetical protein Z949_442 [Sulfitobacter guttiformis KCTC 32187]RKE97739.1 hypothetical protein C8N30_2364 [Sulfitobacter guttiformis]